MKQRGKNIIFNVNYLLEIKGRLSLAEKSLGERDYNLAEIVLKSITELLREVRKF